MTPALDALALRIAARYGAHPRVVEAARDALRRALDSYNPTRGAFGRFARREIRRRAARIADRLSTAEQLRS